jgi:hypothetical protein
VLREIPFIDDVLVDIISEADKWENLLSADTEMVKAAEYEKLEESSAIWLR